MDSYESSCVFGVMNFFSCNKEMAEKIIIASEKNGEIARLKKMCGQFQAERNFNK